MVKLPLLVRLAKRIRELKPNPGEFICVKRAGCWYGEVTGDRVPLQLERLIESHGTSERVVASQTRIPGVYIIKDAK